MKIPINKKIDRREIVRTPLLILGKEKRPTEVRRFWIVDYLIKIDETLPPTNDGSSILLENTINPCIISSAFLL